jgi:NADH-quinone oxidoreductase subunit L
MRWPVLLLTVPAAVLGLLAYLPGFRTALELDEPHLTVALILPLVLVAFGAGGAWFRWRAAPGVDPAEALGRLRPVFARAFYLDEVQRLLIVRPVTALAGAVRTVDERVVDGAVEGSGTGATRLGGLLALAHRAALPRAAVAVLAGAVLLAAAAAYGGVR